MGLIKVETNVLENIISDQWLDYVYCERMHDIVLFRKGETSNNTNINGIENEVINGSKILVNDDQCLIVVSNGKIIDFTVEPGRYIFDDTKEPIMLCGVLGQTLIESLNKFNEMPIQSELNNNDYRVYFVNTKYIKGNKFGTITPIPYEDNKLGLTINIKCYGEYIIQITDPITFYYTYCNNSEKDYIFDDDLKNQFLSDFLNAFQLSLVKMSEQNKSYDILPELVSEVSKAVKECLQEIKGNQGINVVRVSVASVTPTEESLQVLKSNQENKINSENLQMEEISESTKNNQEEIEEHKNISENSIKEFMPDMDFFNIDKYKTEDKKEIKDKEDNNINEIFCPKCGSIINGNFCSECGEPKPKKVEERKCLKCGTIVDEKDKFCFECGAKL